MSSRLETPVAKWLHRLLVESDTGGEAYILTLLTLSVS